MQIDFNATEERCRILNYSAVGRRFHLTRETIRQIICGEYRSMKSPNAVAVLNLLREMNMLVEVSDEPSDFDKAA